MNRSFLRSPGPGGLALATALLLASCSSDRNLDPLAPGAAGGAVVAGRVQESGGAAGAGVTVTLESVVDGQTAAVREVIRMAADGRIAPAAGGFSIAAAGRATVTDAAGRFAFAGIEPGAYVASATSRNHLAGTLRFEVPVTAAETTFVNLSITPTGTFSGVATREGEPVHEGTIVYVESASWLAVTDATGAWVMRQVPTGTHTLVAMHEDFLDASVPGTLTAAGDSVEVDPMELVRDRNLPPSVVATAGAACSGDPVALDASGGDPDGMIVRYEWDFEDDGVVDHVSVVSAAVSHPYPPGSHRAKLSVRDDDGAYTHSVVSFTVGATSAWYVQPGGGGAGTAASPFTTIGQALAAAALDSSACRPVVYVATGVYNESPTILGSVDIRGGLSAGSWTRLPGAYSDVSAWSNGLAVVGASDVRIEGLRVTSAPGDTSGASSYAMRILNCPSNIELVDCRLIAGSGAAGSVGQAGINGTAGGNGQSGSSGSSGSSNGGFGGGGGIAGSPGGSAGGAGGRGGYDGSGANGSATAACASGGTGGAMAGTCFIESAPGGPGGIGCVGAPGANGASSTGGPLQITGWVVGFGSSGTGGTGGRGGGGGGGGGSGNGTFPCDADRGGGGAGGGGGGGSGGGAGGGIGGGASIALFVYGSSDVTVTGCQLTSGNGGSGGAGGAGGTGGAGGFGASGGPGPDDAGNGGNSLAGGAGGGGGGGAGGPGGPSWGAAWANVVSAPSFNSVSYVTGSGGSGGLGGLHGATGSPAATGPTGASGSTHSESPGMILASTRRAGVR